MTSSHTNMFDRICRTCLNADGELLPIFSKGQHVSNLPKKIMASIHFKISEDDQLPKMMCKKCIFLADSFYCFKQQCESANEKLKKFYKMMTEGNLRARYGMDEYINNDIYGRPYEPDYMRCKTNKETANADDAYDSENDYFVEYISEEVRIEVENALKRKRDAQRKVDMERLSQIIKNLGDVEVVPVSTCRATANLRSKNEDKQDIVVFPLKKLSSTTSSNNDNSVTRHQTTMKRKIPSSCACEETCFCHGEKKSKVSTAKDDSKCLNDVSFVEAEGKASVEDHPIEILATNVDDSNKIVMDEKHIEQIHNQVPMEMGVSLTNDTAGQDAAMSIETVQRKGIHSRAKQKEDGLQLPILEGNAVANNEKEQHYIDSETVQNKPVDDFKKNHNDEVKNKKFDFHPEKQEENLKVVAGEFEESKSLTSTINDFDKKSTTSMHSKTDDTVDIIYLSDEENPEGDVTEGGLYCSSNITRKEERNMSEDIQDFKHSGEAREYQEVYLMEEMKKKEEFLVIADTENPSTKLRILDGNLNLYQCTICNLNFASMPTVLKHNIQEHMTTQDDYSCLICKKVFNDKSLLSDHVEQHSDLKSYRCSFCPKLFALKKDLKKHINHHSNDKPLLSNHASIRSINSPFTCLTCDLAFSSKSKWDTHIATVHDQLATITCKYCKTKFPKKSIAKVHAKIGDNQGFYDKLNDQNFLCPSCGKASSQTKIRHDPSTYASKKFYKCKECSASFTVSSALQRHIALHAKKRSMLRCDKCKKKFVDVYELGKHLRDRHRKFSQSKDTSKEENLLRTVMEVVDVNGESEKKSKEGQDVTCNQVQLDVAEKESQDESEEYDKNDISSEKTEHPAASEIILE